MELIRQEAQGFINLKELNNEVHDAGTNAGLVFLVPFFWTFGRCAPSLKLHRKYKASLKARQAKE